MSRSLTAGRRKTVVFASMSSVMGGVFGLVHESYARSPHEHAIASTYLALMCVPLGLAILELVKSKQESACQRA